MRLYFAKVRWYDNYNQKEPFDNVFVFGNNMGEAINRLDEVFDGMFEVNIEEVCNDCSPNVLYMPINLDKKFLDEIKDANNY